MRWGRYMATGSRKRIQQVSEDLLKLNQGTLYPALLRLEQRGWIASKWGVSDNNRKAKYYSLTRLGPETACCGGRELGAHGGYHRALAGRGRGVR